MTRLAIEATGIVQGVGMRPFVHRAATERGLVGWVQNEAGAVRIEVQGRSSEVHAFVENLAHRCPPPASIERIVVREVEERDEASFRILGSVEASERHPAIPTDLAVCDECALEVDDRGARRYRYPFANCTRCGPRFTIVEGLPYDRARTSMRAFAMCFDCAAEYEAPADRRFHAQPIACPACGPQLTLLSSERRVLGQGDAALCLAAAGVVAGEIVAIKGIGGYQLLVDATSERAVARLRTRKHREAKPFAVMFPSLEALRGYCIVSDEEERELVSPAAPILLVRRRGGVLADGVAPNNPRVGAMLPYSPLHRLLSGEIARPFVCTSGNLSDEPMCTDDADALDRLGGIADLFLLHDRPIVRPADDSVGRMGPHGLTLLRRARGYAPLPWRLNEGTPIVLALGAQLKSTVALAMRGQVVVSQHLGDMHSAEAVRLLARTADDLLRFYDVRPEVVACDEHPDYASTRLAEHLATSYGVPLVRVQHHHAHVAAGMAEYALEGPVLGIAWDGSGHGSDQSIWGGEFLWCEGSEARRVAHLRPFGLPGGAQAVREPRRAALGVLHEVFGQEAVADYGQRWFGAVDAAVLARMMARSCSTPRTTSMGRLFDAVAALVGLGERARFEGQAAMALEFAAESVDAVEPYAVRIKPGDPLVVDWEPLVRAVSEDLRAGVPVSVISARFHETLAAFAEDVASRVGAARVVLAGGCFQNARLARRAAERLERRGLRVNVPRAFPPNDGGISLGQVLIASRRALRGGAPCA
jgi:hydrogenase maturation protein HypF